MKIVSLAEGAAGANRQRTGRARSIDGNQHERRGRDQ
jgi:hypothetical protein